MTKLFVFFTCKVPFESHPKVGTSVAHLTLNVILKTTHSLLSKLVSIFVLRVVREAKQCDGHNTGLV